MNQNERRARFSRWWKASPLIALAIGVGCNTKGSSDAYLEPTSSPIAPAPGPQPTFDTTTSLPSSPPPISGGTMAVAPNGHTVVAADSDRDRIYVVDVPTRAVTYSIKLADRSEPGRVVIDGKNRAHVSLRGTGNVATVDLATGNVTERHVCGAPRGLAYDADADTLHVACMDGFLASIPLGGGDVRHIALDRDVRDVVITKNRILVSRFRAGDVIALTRNGEVEGKATTRGGNIAWRMIANPPPPPPSNTQGSDAGTSSSDEDESDEPVIISQDPNNPAPVPGGIGYYGSGSPTDACYAPTITPTRLDIPGRDKIVVPPAVLPVDIATNGREYAIVAAGNGHTKELPQIFVHRLQPRTQVSDPSSSATYPYPSPSSSSPYPYTGVGATPECFTMEKGFVPGQAIAAVFDGDDNLLVQSREPAKLFIMSPDRQRVAKEITLSDESREDTGHAIFHSNSGGFLACASCHAEGGEDGRTWKFVEGDRRTPSMRGTIRNTAPFHWDGAMKDVRQLVDHVFVTRMSGPHIDDPKVKTLQTWLENVPPPPKLDVKDPAAVERGADLFSNRGCSTCHAGSRFTNNENRDVGTGGAFQVPSLVGIGWRAPYLHTGCAKTMKNRFDGSCGGDKHGDTAGLTAGQIDDLTSFLDTL